MNLFLTNKDIFMRDVLVAFFYAFTFIFITACGSDTSTSMPIIKKTPPIQEQNPPTVNTTKNVSKEDPNPVVPQTKPQVSTNAKIFLIGDSVVAISTQNKQGWGNRFSEYMKNPQNFYNVAIGGVSSRSYKQRDTKDWNKTKALIKRTDISEGAYLMIHLGINDIARDREDALNNNNKTTMPGRFESYYNELKVYTDWAKNNDVIPVLITPVEAMIKYNVKWEMEHYFKREYGDYAQTVRELAADDDILLLDLEQKSYDIFNNYDPDQLIKDFSGGIDEDGRIDRVHFSNAGAYTVAGWVKELICDSQDSTFCAQFK